MAKKSSKSRQQGAKKQQSIFTQPRPQAEKPQQPAVTTATSATNEKVVDFMQEYFYVYQDLRSLLLVTVLMFAVLAGLSFAI